VGVNDLIKWYQVNENDQGIETIAIETGRYFEEHTKIVGYNGILKGDKVNYQDEEYTVVMVSRLGHIGLSKTGALPYTETAYPTELIKESQGSY